jgi:hypothetical protein
MAEGRELAATPASAADSTPAPAPAPVPAPAALTPAAASTPAPAPAEPGPYDPGLANQALMITFERGLQVPQPPLADIEKKQGETR